MPDVNLFNTVMLSESYFFNFLLVLLFSRQQQQQQNIVKAHLFFSIFQFLLNTDTQTEKRLIKHSQMKCIELFLVNI